MNIFDFRDNLIESYHSFSRSFTKINSPDIAEEVNRECFEKKRFWPDPLLQINPCYKTGESVETLAAKGVLHPLCAKIFRDKDGKSLLLYKHQEQAVDFAAKKESYVVTTGTGSGKSLTFFIPIVDRILREKEAERQRAEPQPRTRAIILYPMNALANSQYEEIEKYLKNAAGSVSVRRYTGQERGAEREELKANPPDILLTNYMMLELVLMREGDRKFVTHCEGLEYLVLDELHTYRGRQGADVAMLVRRLRAQLKADGLVCIGTSATMASGRSREEQNGAVANFASRIFGTDISSDRVIGETLQRVTDPLVDPGERLGRAVREAAAGNVNLPDFASFRRHPLACWIERELSVTDQSMRAQPRSLEEVVRALADAADVSQETAAAALKQFLSSFGGEQSLRTDKGRNPFPFKLHQFLSGPGKVYVTLEEPGRRFVTLDGQAWNNRGGENVRLFEAHFCRECGEEYIPVFAVLQGREVLGVTPREIDDRNPEEGVTFGFLTPVRSDQKYHGEVEDLPDDWVEFDKKGELTVKSTLRKAVPLRVKLNAEGRPDPEGTDFWFLPQKFRLCVNCLVQYMAYGKDKNRLIGLSGEGRSSATSMLTLQMLELLYQEPAADPNHDFRKLLGFADNRQDAALQAGHFNDFVNNLILRGGLVSVLQNAAGPLALTNIVDAMMKTFGFDDPFNDAAKLEYLARSVEGVQLKAAQDLVRFTISYRLLRDLEDKNLYTCPSLEKLGLLKIDYLDLDKNCATDDFFSAAPELRAMRPEARREFLRTFVDDLRRRQCIASHYFLPNQQTEARDRDHGLLATRWSLFGENARELSNGSCFSFDERFRKDRNFVGTVLSERSQIVRRLGRRTVWQSHADPEERPKKRSGREVLKVVREAVAVLERMGLLRVTTTKKGEQYRLDESVILWSMPKREGAVVSNDFYRNLYLKTADIIGRDARTLFEFEAQEHTAQVSSEEREEFEMRFRATADDRAEWKKEFGRKGAFRRLPVLYCSPTMELGIDISALNYVYMRNVPPTAANYVQRAGRAGRSGQQALSLTYCAAQSPHDQWFFKHPGDMVQGVVKEPTLDLTNEALVRAHLHSVWMAAAEVDLAPCIVDVLDMEKQGAKPFPILEELAERIRRPEVTARAVELGSRVLEQIKDDVKAETWCDADFVERTMARAAEDFDRAFDAWRTLLTATVRQIEQTSKRLGDLKGVSAQEQKAVKRRFAEAILQKNLLTGAVSKSSNNDFYSYRYLANQGFLPGYNFPAMPMLAWIPASGPEEDCTILSRARFLGISEFGPNNLIYHRGRTYRIRRVKIESAQGTSAAGTQLPTQSAVVCPHCGYAHQLDGRSVVNECENCGGELTQEDVLTGLYKVTMVETEEAERITVEDENRQSQGFDIQTLYRFATAPNGRSCRTTKTFLVDGAEIAELDYASAATLWRVNLGWRGRRSQTMKGFYINPLSGYWSAQQDEAKPQAKSAVQEPEEMKPEASRQLIIPFVSDTRNILLLKPVLPGGEASLEAMATLQAALKRAIEQYFQVESSEVFVEPIPTRADRQQLLIYESGEGGAGILRRLVSDPKALQEVADAALRLMHYAPPEGEGWSAERIEDFDQKPDCVRGCYECLLTYYNQPDHALIDRRNPAVLRFLAALASGVVPVEAAAAPEEPPAAAPGGTPWERFKRLLAGRGGALPDKEPHHFKRLGISVAAAYSAHRTVLIAEPLSADDLEALDEVGWQVIDLTDESHWEAVIAAHRDVFGC